MIRTAIQNVAAFFLLLLIGLWFWPTLALAVVCHRLHKLAGDRSPLDEFEFGFGSRETPPAMTTERALELYEDATSEDFEDEHP